jgi:hypothetical protein
MTKGGAKMTPKPTSVEHTHEHYSELSTVESQRNEILQEEFPEGPYGASTNEARLGKATGWEPGQHSTTTRFTYETREMHQDLPRQDPSAHPIHDDPNEKE